MAIKVEVKDTQQKKVYPYLAKNKHTTSLIVLFFEENKFIVLENGTTTYEKAEILETSCESENYSEFNGEITLRND